GPARRRAAVTCRLGLVPRRRPTRRAVRGHARRRRAARHTTGEPRRRAGPHGRADRGAPDGVPDGEGAGTGRRRLRPRADSHGAGRKGGAGGHRRVRALGGREITARRSTGMTVASQLDRNAFVSTLDRFRDLGLLSESETDEVLSLFDPEFPY